VIDGFSFKKGLPWGIDFQVISVLPIKLVL